MSTRIGLFGFGCVAQGFYEGLKKSGIDAEIIRICVKNPDKKRNAPAALFTTLPEDILTNAQVDLVVELIDDADYARHIVHESLRSGKPVISANKKMIAENLTELITWQQTYQTPLLYEGAVAGSIPILQNLQHFFGNQQISRVRGIVNGSTNFILTKMKNESASFESALKEAQQLGFAESDPWLDISGTDAVYKVVILAYHAFGHILRPDQVKKTGISELTLGKILDSRKEGQKIKLVASIEWVNDVLHAEVAPRIVTEGDPLYFIDHENNAIVVEGSLSGAQTYIGKGAGSLPTGSAVLNDLNLLMHGFQYPHVTRRNVA